LVKTKEDFQPDVGAFLDNVDGEIVDAEFDIAGGDYADKVMMGGADVQPPVVIKLTIESPELDRPAVQSYSVGSQDIWEIQDNGKTIQNVKNPDRHLFRKGSRAWSLVEAIALALGEGNLEKGQESFIKRDSYMTEAKFYTGLNFHWIAQSLPTVGGQKTNVPLPEKFLGAVETKARPAAKTKGVVTVEDEGLDQILIDNASGKDERALKSFAVRNPEIKANDAYMKAVVSGKKLKELEDAGKLTRDPDAGTYL